ncbi:MAG TPA: dienelactone hydrolase family protein [Stellaceae bacterium]|nr:dienelactone hydrolase family protein [Stellaceae bacterium]
MADGQWITLAEDGQRRLAAYEARPAARAGGAAILLFHDMFGLGAPFRELAERYADDGHHVLAPNLFWRSDPDGVLPYDGGHERGWTRLQSFDFDRATADVRVALAVLRERSGGRKVAAIGFCFSGVVSFLAAARTDVDAAAAFYALGISRYVSEAARIACPVQLHYGLADDSVPMTEIDAVAAALQSHPRIERYLYPGVGHSFFNPVRPMYDPDASALAGARVAAMLGRLG